jgi:hypothetical protein
MEFNAVVGLRFKFVGIKVLNNTSLPSGANRLFSSGATSIDLNMDDVVALRPKLGVVIDTTIKDDVTWLHFFFLENDWQGVKLIGLVPTVKIETKILSHIVSNLAQ